MAIGYIRHKTTFIGYIDPKTWCIDYIHIKTNLLLTIVLICRKERVRDHRVIDRDTTCYNANNH